MDKKFKLEVLEKMSALITAGLGLVAALAWNEAIKKLFVVIFGEQSNLAAMFGYAAFVTVIVVFLTIKISSLASKLKQDDEAPRS